MRYIVKTNDIKKVFLQHITKILVFSIKNTLTKYGIIKNMKVKAIPMAIYYNEIDLKYEDTMPLSGTVSIVR